MSTNRRAFTLIELLIATALLISVVAVATLALNQMLHMVRRLQALQDMNGAAALVHSRLTQQVSSMHPCTALWLSQDASDNSVELVFMHGLENSGAPPFNTDQRWTRWHWSRATGVLSISAGRGERSFRVGQSATSGYWHFTPNTLSGSNRFMLVPQPVRNDPPEGEDLNRNGVLDAGEDLNGNGRLDRPSSSGIGPQGEDLNRNGVLDAGEDLNGNGKLDWMLEANTWDTGQPGDIGDYEDLKRNALPVLQGCTACTIEVVNLDDNNTYLADGTGTGVVLATPGLFVDGRPYTTSPTPSIVRLRFTLATPYLLGDPQTTVQATYSFSASAPNDTKY